MLFGLCHCFPLKCKYNLYLGKNKDERKDGLYKPENNFHLKFMGDCILSIDFFLKILLLQSEKNINS